MLAPNPKALKKGDQVNIVSTARKIEVHFVNKAIEILEGFGMVVVTGENILSASDQFAGTDTERIADLNAAICDPKCRAIICARGGYGTVRLLDNLDLAELKRDPKWIVGFSDVTALLNHVFNQTGIHGIHGTMPINYETVRVESLSSLKACLFGDHIDYKITSLNQHLNISGTAEGRMVGGNLSVIYSLLGSNSALTGIDQILFIEDLDEYLYHIDRMMMALKRSGLLTNIKGLVVGGMSGMHDNAIPFGKSAVEIIASHVADLNIPVCFGFESGHLDQNLAWIHGKKIRLTVNNGQPVSLIYL